MIIPHRLLKKPLVPIPNFVISLEKYRPIDLGAAVYEDLDTGKCPANQVGAGVEVIKKMASDIVLNQKINSPVRIILQGNSAEFTLPALFIEIIICP